MSRSDSSPIVQKWIVSEAARQLLPTNRRRDMTSISNNEDTMNLAHVSTRAMRNLSVGVAISLSFGSILTAQAPAAGGMIAGTVHDPVGDVAPKIVVQARSSDGQTVRRATSESTGKYII